MVTNTVPSSVLSGKYCSTGKAASLAGTCIQTIKNWIAQGILEAYQTRQVNGHWKVSVSSLKSVLGIEESTDNDAEENVSGVFCYIRVSSESQQQAGSMNRQRERVVKAVMEKEGLREDQITVIAECASALADRKGLNSLCDAMLDGTCKKIYCAWEDRISRLASTMGIVKHIANRCGTVIEALEEEPPADENALMVKELLSIITIYSNRASAMKAKIVCEKKLTPETITRIIELQLEACSIKDIESALWQEGHRTSKDDKVSHHKIRQVLDGNGTETLAKALTNSEDTFNVWFTSRVNEVQNPEKANQKTRVRSSKLYPLYCEDMKRQGKKVHCNKIRFGQMIASRIPKERIIKSGGGLRHYWGFTIKD